VSIAPRLVRRGSSGNGLGDGGHRLHEWAMTDGDVDLEAIRRSGGVNGRIVDEFMATGAPR
jgi:hypothetical protein